MSAPDRAAQPYANSRATPSGKTSHLISRGSASAHISRPDRSRSRWGKIAAAGLPLILAEPPGTTATRLDTLLLTCVASVPGAA